MDNLEIKWLQGKIAIRDLVMRNLLTHIIDEETGQNYIESLRVADAELDAALKASVGD